MSAISVLDVNFSYSNQKILKEINANISYGKVYSLLGPSGAGKTTLLRLILGRIKPTNGSITVLGDRPGKNNRMIGYMPQDSALCLSFTVGQTLQYFANIYRLPFNEFQKRKAEISAVLTLPDDNLLVSELSGGQQKMVSLSLAFLHRPKLLILDEPTVGSDPVLGHCIWNYLHQCCTQNMSIIIVTHYIEEAAFGHLVGIMRNGKILEEGSPDNLIVKYNKNTLEEVFLFLCKVDNDFKPIKSVGSSDGVTVQEANGYPATIESQPSSKQIINGWFRNALLNIWILCVLIRKNLSRFFQFNISFLIFLIPAFQALLLCSIYNQDAVPINVAVINDEFNPHYSQKLLDSIEKVDVYYIKPNYYDSHEAAIQAITDGKAVGAVWFNQNYSDALDSRIIDPENIDNQTLSMSEVKLFVDTTNYLYFNGFYDSLRQTVYQFLGKVSALNNVSQFDAPIEVREIIYAKDSKLSDFLLPGYLISFIYLSQVSLSSQLLIQEKKDGLFERSLVAGVGHNLVFFSHFISSCILSTIQIVLMLVVSLFLFQVTNFGSYQLIFILVFVQAANAVSVGLLISAIFNEGFVAILVSIFVTFSQLFTSGSIFPMEFVEPSLRQYLYLCPIALPSESLRNVMLRAWNITHPYVYNGLVVNLVGGVACTLLATIIFKH